MFDSIYSSTVTAAQFFLMGGIALVSGFIYAWIMSWRVRSQPRFFIVAALFPFLVATVVTFVKGNIGAGVAIGGGVFGLIRFRSAQGTADELVTILITMAGGIAFGMGYAGYGVIILLVLALLYCLFSAAAPFTHKGRAAEQLLRITIPESLDYTGVFDDIFEHYLSSVESAGMKTTGMGSMFRLSFKIRMKNPKEEKAMVDEIRTRNGNLEIAVLPYREETAQL